MAFPEKNAGPFQRDTRYETTRRLLKAKEVPLICLTNLSSLASFAIVFIVFKPTTEMSRGVTEVVSQKHRGYHRETVSGRS
jgi:hypothetical protein